MRNTPGIRYTNNMTVLQSFIILTNDGCITVTLLGYSIGSKGGGGGCPFRRRSEYTTRVSSFIGEGCGLLFFTLVCCLMIDRSAYTTSLG